VSDRESKRPVRESKPRRTKTARPTKAPTDLQQRILSALSTAGEMSPGRLAKALQLPPQNVAYHLKPMIAAGQVRATGVSTGRRLSIG
jgi:predicted ArsR family transcriptional regulator